MPLEMKTVRTKSIVTNLSPAHVVLEKREDAGDDDDDYCDEDCDDPTTTITPLMESCLASHEFEWLTPTSISNLSSRGSIGGKDIIHSELGDERSNVIASAAIPPQPQHKSLRKSTGYRQRRPKEREYTSCRMSPTPCYDSHLCHHRLSPMRSSWCCPSPPPTHIPSIPVCLHHGGSSTGMEIVPYGQECYSEEHAFGSCCCLPPTGRQHTRYNSPCACHHCGSSHFGECSPSSPQQTYRNIGQRSHSMGSRRREFSPSSSPLHRPCFSNDVPNVIMPPRNSTSLWDEQWKSPIHSEDINGLQKIQQLEADKKNLILQVSVLNDQVDAQAEKIRELDSLLEDRKDQLRQVEHNLHQEIMSRSVVENSKLELMTEISNLRLRLTAAERDRKDSDEKCRKIESSLNAHIGDTDAEQSSPFRNKLMRNGTLISQADGSAEVERLHSALESILASNEEKDKKIEDLRLSLIKYKKLHDFVLSGHQKKGSDFAMKETQVDSELLKNVNVFHSTEIESTKVKFISKPPSGHRGLFFPSQSDSVDSANNANPSLKSGQLFHRSNSLENVRQPSAKTPSPETPYGTIPRQSGQQVLQHLQEQLQHHESGTGHPKSHSVRTTGSHSSPTPSNSSRKQQLRQLTEGSNRASRNKSSGVSFGKGFFKLRLGKRSSSAPELAPFENVAVTLVEREVSSASPTPQPTMQPFFIKPERDRSKNFLKFFTKWKRSGSQNIEKLESDFRRGGIRATAGPRLGWSRDISIDPDIPFSRWNTDIIVEWLHKIGLSMYISECKKWGCSGEQLINSSPHELEKVLNIKNPLHKKKLVLALQGMKSDSLPDSINQMDYQWVVRWLDDVGLPQYKDSFSDARVDGRVLHYMTVDDLLSLKVTNQLHHISIKRGIQVLREKNFSPHCLTRRSLPDEDKEYTPELVALWTNHRVMEWLRTVDLSEYAPNLRGSGVHGALVVYEPKFNTDLFATLLNIPPTKTLLRRHLTTHFKSIVGAEYIQAKRDLEADQLYIPLTPNIKIKGIRKPQFALKKTKGKGDGNSDEFICPMDISLGSAKPNGEKLIVRRNSDPAFQDSRLLDSQDEKAAEEIGAVSKEISCLTVMLQEEKLLKNAPTTNV